MQFSGTRSDVSTIYPDLDLAVVPTHSDGLAYSVVEPLLAGVPVVATNAGGIPDLIRDGDTGWLVPPANPAALVRAVLDALADPEEARRRAARGRNLTRNLLDLEKTGREVAAVYEKVLAVPAPRLVGRIESPGQTAAVQSDATVMRSQLPSTEV